MAIQKVSISLSYNQKSAGVMENPFNLAFPHSKSVLDGDRGKRELPIKKWGGYL